MTLSGEHLIVTQKKKNSGKDSEVLAQRSNEKTDFITRVNNVVLSLSTSEDGFNFLSISCQHMITNNGLWVLGKSYRNECYLSAMLRCWNRLLGRWIPVGSYCRYRRFCLNVHYILSWCLISVKSRSMSTATVCHFLKSWFRSGGEQNNTNKQKLSRDITYHT